MTRKTPAKIKPNDRSSRRDVVDTRLVEYKFFPPFRIGFQRFLLGLVHQLVSQDKKIDLCAHEAAIGVFGCAYDWFASHVKGSIDNGRAPRHFFKGLNKAVVHRISVCMDGLDAYRIVDVSHRWYIRARNVKQINAP